jgi:hypothetical protein
MLERIEARYFDVAQLKAQTFRAFRGLIHHARHCLFTECLGIPQNGDP